ncbi:MAG: 16S rRNA (cytidine(1402)-2'-O)-methyltransferase [Oscillospiraceae bacterium]
MNNLTEKGALYVVATPIGNLSDFTKRAESILKQVDFIAAEDTRVTQKLLSHFEIKKPLISYYEHNIRQKGEEILQRLSSGETCAIVSDAGMPCISDPGEDIVYLCRENGINVYVVPGACAAVGALAISGISTKRFAFEGFLSTNKNKRIEHLQKIKNDDRTLIFYEAPHKLITTLKDLQLSFGDRKISIIREMTKIYEEVIYTTLNKATQIYSQENKPRGEYVLVVQGNVETIEFTIEDAILIAKKYIEKGEKVSEAAKLSAKETGIKKSDIYKLLQ